MGFPAMFYASDGTTKIVQNQAEEDALSGAWFDSPAGFGLITAPSALQLTALTTTYSTGVTLARAAPNTYAPNGIQVVSQVPLASGGGSGLGLGGGHGQWSDILG